MNSHLQIQLMDKKNQGISYWLYWGPMLDPGRQTPVGQRFVHWTWAQLPVGPPTTGRNIRGR